MGKAAGILATVGVGGAGLAIGGVYISKMFNKYYELPSDVEKFKESKGGGCVQDLFPGIAIMKKDGNVVDVDSSDKKLGEDTNNPVQGCLVINWDKWKGTENNKDKWKGNFRFLWSMTRGNKGFIVYFTADTPNPPANTNGTVKLKVNGVAYVLNKKDNENNWDISKGKEINQELESSKLPKLEDGLKGKKDKNKEWKFVEDNENFSELCSEQDCLKTQNLSEFFRGYWVWKENKDGKTADSWSSNLTDWWQKIYEDDKWKMQDVLKDVKGKWEGSGPAVYHKPRWKK